MDSRFEIEWSYEAGVSFETYLQRYEHFGGESAELRLKQRVIEAIEQLRDFPYLGRAIPELPGVPLRELISSPFRIIYQVNDRVVEVVAIVRGEQDIFSE